MVAKTITYIIKKKDNHYSHAKIVNFIIIIHVIIKFIFFFRLNSINFTKNTNNLVFELPICR